MNRRTPTWNATVHNGIHSSSDLIEFRRYSPPVIMSIGTIPVEICQAQSLWTIDLSNNQLSGAVYRVTIRSL